MCVCIWGVRAKVQVHGSIGNLACLLGENFYALGISSLLYMSLFI